MLRDASHPQAVPELCTGAEVAGAHSAADIHILSMGAGLPVQAD